MWFIVRFSEKPSGRRKIWIDNRFLYVFTWLWHSYGEISIIGAVCHNMAQIAVAAFVVKNNGIYYYVPMLLIAGVITGGIIGVVSRRVLNILKK